MNPPHRQGSESSSGSQPFHTKSAWVASELRRMILSGELVPGERLHDQEVAGWFQCSPTPVREAIRQLSSEGLIDQRPHHPPQVINFAISEPVEVYLIQAQFQRLAVVLSGTDGLAERVAQAALVNEEMRALTAAGDLGALRTLNYQFHFSLFDCRKLSWLTRIIAGLWSRLPDVLSSIPGRPERTLQEHDEILRLLAAGDPVQGGRAMLRHLQASAREISGVEPEEGLFDP